VDSKNNYRQKKEFGESFHKKTVLAVNGYFQLYPYCGQGRYLREFVRWAKKNPLIDLKICYPADTKNKLYQLIFEQLLFPLFCWLTKAEKIFIPYFAPPIWSPEKTTVTVHDLIHFRLPGLKWSTGLYKNLLLWNLKRVDKIITDSPWSEEDITTRSGVSREKISVIPLGVDRKVFFPSKKKRKNFFLWIGNDSSHKQKSLLFDIYKSHKIATPLLMIGLKKDPEIPGITVKNNLSDRELADLYNSARALITTSAFEGFGLPVLEALVCHCPVIALKISPIDSIAEGRATFFGSSKELVQLLNKPPQPINSTIKINQFTWLNTFSATFAIITK
jgi:glycosyltransferase involved in cell wall biosynthesis